MIFPEKKIPNNKGTVIDKGIDIKIQTGKYDLGKYLIL